MKRLVNASKNFVLLMIKPKDNVENESFQGCDVKLKSDLYEIVNTYDEMLQGPKGFDQVLRIMLQNQSVRIFSNSASN